MDHHSFATVAELADAPDLGSGITDVGVQVSSVAPYTTRGSGSVVERRLAKANVAGPNPVSRSIKCTISSVGRATDS